MIYDAAVGDRHFVAKAGETSLAPTVSDYFGCIGAGGPYGVTPLHPFKFTI